ncbi:acyltransferase [Planococcus sp. APC 4015]|nr:acyltransferase [Planococcus sp. APC 4015]
MRARMRWMDVLRGAAIGLVILAHSAYILDRFELGDTPGWLISINELFAPFRMPTLMVLSGMLVTAGLRKPLGTYFAGKLRRIGWPYLVWLVLWCVLFPAYGNLFTVDTWTTAYVWFLLYLLAYYSIAPITRWVPTWLLIVIPWAVASLPLGQFQRRFFFLMGFFFLGKLITDHIDVFDRILRSRWVWAAVAFAAVYGAASSILDPRQYLGYLAPFSAVGIIGAVKLAQLVDDKAWTRPLQFVGRNSLVFYVTHFPVITAVSWVGFAAGSPPLITFAAGFVLAIAVGAGATWLNENSVARILFTFPSRRRVRERT